MKQSLDDSEHSEYTLNKLRELKRAWAECDKCALHETRQRCVFGDGAPLAKIMIIGDRPDEKENKSGIPFSGPNGEVLRYLMEKAKLSSKDVHTTNLVLCYPPEGRSASKKEVGICNPRLIEQIRLVDPLLIIALGEDVTKTLIGTRGAKATAGEITDVTFRIDHTIFMIPILTTYSLSKLLRDPDTNIGGSLYLARKHFEEAANIIKQFEALTHKGD